MKKLLASSLLATLATFSFSVHAESASAAPYAPDRCVGSSGTVTVCANTSKLHISVDQEQLCLSGIITYCPDGVSTPTVDVQNKGALTVECGLAVCDP